MVLIIEKCTLLVSPQPPFYSRNTAEMYDNILHKPLRLRSNISESARNILAGVSELVSYNISTHMYSKLVVTCDVDCDLQTIILFVFHYNE